MALYAAYGSNMDPRQMAERAPHSPLSGSGWLDGWRLTFGGEDLGWEGALATVVEEPGEHVFVVLYDLTPSTSTPWTPGRARSAIYDKIRVRVADPRWQPAGLAVRPQRLRRRPALGPLPGDHGRRRRGSRSP